MSKLSRHGYVIRKKNYTNIEIETIKNDLTVSPFVINDYGNSEKKLFKLYTESSKKLYLPRYYGFSKFGKPERNIINDGDSSLDLKTQLCNFELIILFSSSSSVTSISAYQTTLLL